MSSICHHMDRSHSIVLTHTIVVDVGGGGGGYLRGLLFTDPEVGGMPGRRVSVKVKQSREATGALHVSALEGRSGDFTGGTATATKV